MAAAGLFMLLGSRGLNEPDEGRYASVAANMVRTDAWLVPELNGNIHLTKPPLTYWLMAISMKAFGMNEWSARLPSASAALGVIMMTWSIAGEYGRRRTAMYAPLILLSSPLFFVMGRIADTNMLLTFWVTLGIWSWEKWQRGGGRGIHWLYYGAHVAAFMTKGPVGQLFILLWIFAMNYARRRQGQSTRTIWSWPLFIAAVAASLWWYLVLVIGDLSLLNYFVHGEILDRLAGHNHRRHEPFWFYLAVLAGGFLPWLPFLMRSIRDAVAGHNAKHPHTAPLAIAIAVAVLFFTIIQSKLATYIAPVFPWIALLISSAMAHSSWNTRSRNRARRCSIAVLMIAPAGIWIFGEIRYGWPLNYPLIGCALLMTALTSGLIMRVKIPWLMRITAVSMLTYLFILLLQLRVEDQLSGSSTPRGFLREVNAQIASQPGPIYFSDRPRAWGFYSGDLTAKQQLNVFDEGNRFNEENLRTRVRAMPQSAWVIIKKNHFASCGDWTSAAVRTMAEDHRFVLLQRTDAQLN